MVSWRIPVAFMRRDWLTARSYRVPFYFSLAASTVMLILLYEVGRLVDRAHITGNQLGHGYFSFVLVGMAVLQIVHTALQSFTHKLRQEQTTGTLEALLATPASPSLVIISTAFYELAQATLMSVVLMLVGSALGFRVVAGVGSLLASIVILAGLLALFAGLGVAVAAFTVAFKRGAALAGLISIGLGLLGGVYFPVSLLPGPVQALAKILPFTWGVDALRKGLLSGSVDGVRMGALLASAVVMVTIALVLFRVSVDYARRRGSLAQY